MKLPRKGDMSHHPGEPLYTLHELDLLLGLPTGRLHGMKTRRPGLNPWSVQGRGSFNSRPQNNLYRLSDARRWFDALPEEVREKARKP